MCSVSGVPEAEYEERFRAYIESLHAKDKKTGICVSLSANFPENPYCTHSLDGDDAGKVGPDQEPVRKQHD